MMLFSILKVIEVNQCRCCVNVLTIIISDDFALTFLRIIDEHSNNIKISNPNCRMLNYIFQHISKGLQCLKFCSNIQMDKSNNKKIDLMIVIEPIFNTFETFIRKYCSNYVSDYLFIRQNCFILREIYNFIKEQIIIIVNVIISIFIILTDHCSYNHNDFFCNKTSMNSSIYSNKRGQATKDQIDFMFVDPYIKQAEAFIKSEDKLCEIERIEQFSRTNKLLIKKKKIQEITKQLELQLTAHLAHLQRMKNKQQFVQFTLNPFNLAQTQTTTRLQANKKRKPPVNIMEGISETKKLCKAAKIKERLTKVDDEFNRIHTCIQKNRRNKQLQSIEVILQPAERQIKKVLNDKDFQFLDELVSRKEEKKLTLKLGDIHLNIFKLLPKRQDKCMPNCRQLLNSLYFCHNSMIYRPQNKQGVNCMRQISMVARQFTTNQHSLIDFDNRLLSTDMMIKLDQLFFEEMMLVSTGVLEPTQLHKNLNNHAKNIDKNDDSVRMHNKQNVDEIFYDQNHEHKSTLIKYDLPDHLLRQKLMSYSLTPKQQQQMQFSIEIQKKLEEILKREETIKRYGINDQKLNRQIQKQRYNIMTMQIQKNADKEKGELEKDLDKKIRLSKLYKDRSEGIKARFIQESVTGVNKHDKKMQPVSLKKKKRQNSINFKHTVSTKSQKITNDQEKKQKQKKVTIKHLFDTQRIFSPQNKQKPRQNNSNSKRKSLSPIKYKFTPKRSMN